MLRWIFILPLLFGFVPGPGFAQIGDIQCDDSARLVKQLQSQNARRMGQGLRDPETVMELWLTSKSGDWVLVQSYANGTSCIVAMGAHWDDFQIGEKPA